MPERFSQRWKSIKEYLRWAAANPEAAKELSAQAEAKKELKKGDTCSFTSGKEDVWIDGTISPYGGTPSVKLFGSVSAECIDINRDNGTGSFRALSAFQIRTAENNIGSRGKNTVFSTNLSHATRR